MPGVNIFVPRYWDKNYQTSFLRSQTIVVPNVTARGSVVEKIVGPGISRHCSRSRETWNENYYICFIES